MRRSSCDYKLTTSCARVYKDSNCEDTSSGLRVDEGETGWVGYEYNDDVTSIRVRYGCTFTGFEHKYKGGYSKSYTSSNDGNLSWGWHNYFSSWICSCYN